jgi:hypothetical protein
VFHGTLPAAECSRTPSSDRRGYRGCARECPPALERLILRALSKDPAMRPTMETSSRPISPTSRFARARDGPRRATARVRLAFVRSLLRVLDVRVEPADLLPQHICSARLARAVARALRRGAGRSARPPWPCIAANSPSLWIR